MKKLLTNKRIVLGVSGSIAAYKSPDIVRRLQDLGAEVIVILTSGGGKFITELSLQATSKNKVQHNLWDTDIELTMGHIKLAKWADVILIAPASANIIANLSGGKAPDLLTNVVLASDCKLLIAPAMNQQMLASAAVVHNLATLKKREIEIIKPQHGEQVCGDVGLGKLATAEFIAQRVSEVFCNTAMSGKNVLITLGATREEIDPVRFLSNKSSGKMGMALAQICVEWGAKVTLIYAHISIPLIDKVQAFEVSSGAQMHKAVMQNISAQDIFISCAAVCDYRVKNRDENKIKKSGANLSIDLIENADILFDVCQLKTKPICIGFAAETQNLIKNAQKKLKNKGCDAIILNDVSRGDFGFEKEQNEVVFLDAKTQTKIGKNNKIKIAQKIISLVLKKFL